MFDFSTGAQILSLETIPHKCKIILVSEEPLPKEHDEEGYTGGKDIEPSKSFLTSVPEKKPKFIGLKNNIYEYQSNEDKIACRKG